MTYRDMSLRFRFAPRVGYMNPDSFREGNTMFGPMFSNVGEQTEGSGSYDVQRLIPTGDVVPNGANTAEAIRLQKLTASGAADGAILYWRNCTVKNKGKDVAICGWYPASGIVQGDMSIKSGEAVWVNFPTGASCTLTVSGEVPNNDIYMGLRIGNSAVCNPMPITLDVQSVLPYGIGGAEVPNGANTAEAIRLQKLTASGAADGAILYWRNCTVKNKGKDVAICGWYPASGVVQGDMSLAPGEGVWVNSPTDTVALVFPSVWKKAAE